MKEFVKKLLVLSMVFLILNWICHAIGLLFVTQYPHFVYSHLTFDSFLLILIVASLMLLFIHFFKKRGEVIFGIVHALIGALLLYNDVDGMGWEVQSTLVFAVSKFNLLLTFIDTPISWIKINVTIVWGCYLVFVGVVSRTVWNQGRQWVSAIMNRKTIE